MKGFLTPAHLHVVRNHGAVPHVTSRNAYEDWKIRVHGLVQEEVEFSIKDLAEKFRVRTFPITIACAGNRRKEQNVVRKSLGFDWGSAGVSTSLWTGVYLADILEYVRPLRPSAQHVIFEGADTTLPKGPYGTSQKLSWAMNRERGMLICRSLIALFDSRYRPFISMGDEWASIGTRSWVPCTPGCSRPNRRKDGEG